MSEQALQETNEQPSPTPQTLAAGMIPKNWADLQRFAETVSQSKLCPKSYRGQPQDAALAILYGMELGLRPLQSLQSVAVINGRPSIYGDAALALVEQSGLAEYVKEWQEQTNDRGLVAYCETKKKGKPEPTKQRFSEKEAKNAGLWGRKGPWEDYPRRMLQMRARSWCLRDAYPEVLEGLMLAEEAEAIPEGNGPTVDPKGDLSQNEPSGNGETDKSESDVEYVQRYGITVTKGQASKIDERDEGLSQRETEELAAAISAVESEMEDWPSDQLVRACDAMLDEHRERLEAQMEERERVEDQSSGDELSGTTLPEDITGRNFLMGAGIETVQQLRHAIESDEGDLEDLDGIGETTAQAARNWYQNNLADVANE